MRVSTQAIQQKIAELAPTISDQELFTSPRYTAHLMDLAEVLTGNYGCPIQVYVEWDTSVNAVGGGTQGSAIIVNAANKVTRSLPTRELRHRSLIGICGHEAGHILYTDFSLRNYYLNALVAGRMFPSKPEVVEINDQICLSELVEILEGDNKLKRQILVQVAQLIRNILEDYYVNTKICQEFGGTIRYGLQLFLVRSAALYPSIQAQISRQYSEYAIMMNTLSQYTIFGKVNDLGGETGKYLHELDKLADIVDSAVVGSTKDRLIATNMILVKLWPYIRSYIDENYDNQQQTNCSEEEQQKKSEEKIKKQVSAPNDTSDGGSPLVFGVRGGNQNGFDLSELQNSILQCLAAGDADREFKITDGFTEGDGGSVEYDDEFQGTGHYAGADEILQMLNSVAKEKVEEFFEAQWTAEMQAEARKVKLGDAHKGVNLIIHRQPVISQDTVDSYAAIVAPIAHISRRMHDLAAPYLLDETESGKETGLLSGEGIDANLIHRISRGGGIFYRYKDEDEMDVAVCVLNDISGSMDGERIIAARATSLVLYEFCRATGVPIMVYGHCAVKKEVHLFSYAEFSSIDGKDRYRIAEMDCTGRNRDGAALRYVGEKLLQRKESVKLLFLTSDGQPNDDDYTGSAAEADLRGIKKEFTNKGITFIAAAIGDDRDVIERIYGTSFMDVTDLNKLPQNFLNVLTKYL